MSSCPIFFCDPLEDKIFSRYIMYVIKSRSESCCLVAQLRLAQKDTLNAIHNVLLYKKIHTVFFLRL
jgi:hypothetical protein